VVGWTTRRVIAAGEPLLPPAVSPPDLVKAGDAVEAVWRGRTIQLRVKGTAAGSAALGERVLVRVDARRRLEGVVIGPALVELESMDRGR
jgi:flagella basal body P-ring formation protein FlgA